MLGVVDHFGARQGLGLTALACLVCFTAAATAMRLLAASPAEHPRQQLFQLAGAIVAFSAGTWATHFIGLLGFHPDVPFGFDVVLCGISLLLISSVTTVSFALRPGRRMLLPLLQGLLLAAGVAAMHVVGMRALLLPGKLYYPADALLLSMGLGFGLTMAGMWLLQRGSAGVAGLALALGTLSIDLLGVTSVHLELTPGLPIPPDVISHPLLVAATSAACLVILLLALGAWLLEQHQARRLSAEARRFRILADATFEGLMLVRHGCIIDANLAMGELAGRMPESLAGQTLTEILPGLSLHAGDEQQQAEVTMIRDDGQTRPVAVLWRDDPDRTGYVVAVRDLSREKAAATLIERLNRLDPPTGLLNGDAFEHQLQQALLHSNGRPTSLAVLHIGLDHFGAVAEQIGLEATEALLVQLAQRLDGLVRRTDTVGRLRRDEFAVLQVVTADTPVGRRYGDAQDTAVNPAALAERILEELSQRFNVTERAVKLKIAIGVAIHPTDGVTARELMRHASLALDQAQQHSASCWRSFERNMEKRLRERQVLCQDLRVALQKGQFTLDYQPVVDAMTFEIAGYEALLRWEHPERGRISPAVFIPLAEESGLIVPIGAWVLEAACIEAMSWRRPAGIAVNLSPAQFSDPALLSMVTEVLHRTGLPAERLELEITETILIDDKAAAQQILTELKALGVRLAMDDFGTGYSSLSYLRSFPFDKIKIDRSFVSDVEHDSEAESIVQAIIAMGMSLQMKITAEGVETKAQLAMLRAYGCTYLQGYLLGKPVSRSMIEGRDTGSLAAAAFCAGSIADALPMLAAAPRAG